MLTVSADHPRALPSEEACAALLRAGIQARAVRSPADALRIALEASGPDDVIVATGSIFVAADVRMAWLAALGRALPASDPPADDTEPT